MTLLVPGVPSINEEEHILTGIKTLGEQLFYGQNYLQSTASLKPMTVTELLALDLFVTLLQCYSCVYTCHMIAMTTMMTICFTSANDYK